MPIGGVRAGYLSGVKDAIPDHVINHWPADEGSGSTLTDAVGDDDISLNFSTWRSTSTFEGGTAPDFDGTDDEGTATENPNARAWSLRVIMDTAKNNSFFVAHGSAEPRIFYRESISEWRITPGDTNVGVSESVSSAEGSERILIAGYDGSDGHLYIYDSDGNEIGSNSAASSFTTPSGGLEIGDLFDNHHDGIIDQIMQHDQWLDSQQRTDLLNEFYL